MEKSRKHPKNSKRTNQKLNLFKSFYRENRITIRSIFIFLFSVAVFCAAIHNDYLNAHVNHFFTLLVARVSNLMINLVGFKTIFNSLTISHKGFSVLVVNECNGVFATGIFISAVLAFPSRFREKLIGILLGFFSIFVINVLRIVGIFYVGVKLPNYLHEAHVWIAQTLVVILGISVWLLWVEGFVNPPPEKAAAVHK